MNVVSVGNSYRVYDDELKTYDRLPAHTYRVTFNSMTGYSLERRSDLEVIEEKVYGKHEEKIDKVMRNYKRSVKNFGVILSGKKGIGKSLFARMLSKSAIDQGMPVVIVDDDYPGLSDYIDSINQEIMVLFDEFEKNFRRNSSNNDDGNVQDKLLSLFDGTSNGKKLFVITCNDLYQLSDYLVNRPGRFHYHFRFGYPDAEQVKQYMEDKLKPEFAAEIDKVVRFASLVPTNFDCLRAIAFEINSGETFESAMEDLNIVNTDDLYYDMAIEFKNGKVFSCNRVTLDLFGDTNNRQTEYLYLTGSTAEVRVTFKTANYEFNYNTGVGIIPPEDISHLKLCNDGLDLDNLGDKDQYQRENCIGITFRKSAPSDIHYKVTDKEIDR